MSDTSNPVPQHTRARACPHCGSAAVTSLGHVLADVTGIRIEYRCRECSKEFFRPAAPLPSPLRGGLRSPSPNPEAPMTNIMPWHSTLATDRPVYHDDTRCPEGNRIQLRDRRQGTGGCPQCAICAAERP